MIHAARPLRLSARFGLIVLAIAWLPEARAQEPSPREARVFTASDLPRLKEQGIRLPKGRYTVKVWCPTRQEWSLTADGSTLTLQSHVDGGDPKPHWQMVGSAELSGDRAVRVVVETDEPKAKAKRSDAESKSAPAPIPVPALLALSNDADFKFSAALDLLRVRVDSVDPPADPRRASIRTNKQGADFRPPVSVDAWRDRARHVREQLLVTMGLWPMPPKTPLNPRVYGKLERDGYTIEKVVLETLPGFTLSGNLYRPAAATDKRPLVLCPHGHWKDGRTNPEVQQRCIRWAKLGCVVFMYDMVGYNDSKPFGHEFLNDRLRRWGFSLVTLQSWNSLRALDWLTTLPDVDPARIACTGESGGGTQTFLLTAIDDRIKVSAPVVMVSDSFQGGCVCENCAGLRIGTDNVEFAALCAPRPLKIVGATGDWTAQTMTHAYPNLLVLYSLMGTTNRVSADVFDFPHNYNQTTRNAVYAFVGKWLLGIEDPKITVEGEQSPEKADDLFTFNDDYPAPSAQKTPAQLEDDLIRGLNREINELVPYSPVSWEAARGLLKTSHRVRVGLVNPTPGAIDETEVRRKTPPDVTTFNGEKGGTKIRGTTVVHALVGRKNTGEKIPVIRLIPPDPSGRLTTIVSGRGKAGLFSADGSTYSTLVQALLARGQTVVGFDPLFVGESLDPSSPANRRPETAHFDTYNPSLAADQMQDLATVLSWARSLPDVREVNLIGQGRGGVQALLARPALEGLGRTAIDLRGFSEGDGAANFPREIDLPGILQFGGLKAAAALTAPAPIWIYRPGGSFERYWPEKAYALANAAHVLRLTTTRPSSEELARWIDTGE